MCRGETPRKLFYIDHYDILSRAVHERHGYTLAGDEKGKNANSLLVNGLQNW